MIDYQYLTHSYIEYATLHVPVVSLEAYRVAEPWKNFKQIVLIDSEEPTGTIEINGLYYNLSSNDGSNIAEVTSNPNEYVGSVVIPESVIYENVNYSVTSIGESAFSHCFNLISVTIPNSVTHIGEYAFKNCKSLVSINIPNSVTDIDSFAFLNCSALSSISIPKDLSVIKSRTFWGCTGLKSVTIPSSINTIEESAFRECSSLTSVTIPNSVTIIGWSAFAYCQDLTSITIGSGIQSIGSKTFTSCNSLKDVYCYALNAPYAYSDAFKDSSQENVILHVPGESIDTYKADEPWKNFKEIIALTDSDPKPDATGVNIIRNSKDNRAVIYDLNGVRQNEFKKGINIINGKKYVNK